MNLNKATGALMNQQKSPSTELGRESKVEATQKNPHTIQVQSSNQFYNLLLIENNTFIIITFKVHQCAAFIHKQIREEKRLINVLVNLSV